ncbi:MAG: hypothetical protein GXO79_01730 [Chlorobi bacterium]|nr:hypothetical protein [Chlorobiota bacterium]
MNNLKKLIIFYFSGTGNAKQLALWLSETTINKGINCQVFDIAKTNVRLIDKFSLNTLIVIISPIHGFNFPKITLEFIEHFPKGKNSIVLMNTRAGMRIGRWITPGLTGVAFLLSSFLLKRKGYKIKGQIPFDMPSNWISIHPALSKKTVKYLHEKNYNRLKHHAEIILSGKSDFLAYRDLIQDILVSPVSLAYYIVGRYAFAKSFYASVQCNNCGLCIKQCPVNAVIDVKGRPFWTFQCESCMKCMNSCPKKAIETAHGLFAILIISSLTVTSLLYQHIKNYIQSELINFTLSTIIFIVFLWILYRIQHLLLQNKFVGNIISLLSFTHYKFWGRYKSIPDKKWKK